jgi:TPR repeat protein
MPTCANCHSFSADGKTMGIDVDGPRNDKGLYAIVPIRPQTTIRNEDVVAWNTDQIVGKSRVGFMSQVSPDGRYVLTTFAGPQRDLPATYFVTNFKDYRFLQVFYPTRGILEWYDRKSGRRQPLPGADDPRYVQTDGVWSPDGKYIVFARAEAKDPFLEGQKPALHANDENETQIKYDLYRIPFNDGKGGRPEPITGASSNGMSNNFPKISPDGRWVVFVKCRNGQLMRPDSQLYIVPATGGVARRMRCNTSLMNSWHSFSPNGRWLVFSSKSRSPYTQMFLTHIDEQGNDSPAIYIERSTAANRAVNIPEFVNIAPDGLKAIDVPAADFYRVVDHASTLLDQGRNSDGLLEWQKAVSMQPDDVRAQNGLAIALYLQGDFDEAAVHFKQANQIDPSSLGDARAASYLGLMFRDGQGVPQNYVQALDLFRKAADRGYPPAEYYLGGMYGAGQGVSRDYVLAATWHQKAAEQGYANAQFALGLMYRDGQGVPQDVTTAINWLRKAADHGNAQAQFYLGEFYEHGQGVQQDFAQALEWFQKAADRGVIPAQDELGAMYGRGEGVQQSFSSAADWYRKAAEKGSANAQLMLGVMYHSGQGVPRDDSEASEWLRKAAEHGVAQAQYYLGAMYGMGQGVEQNYAKAEAWYIKAAEQGFANAQFVLGVMYLSGQGVTQDFAMAYYQLGLASFCTHDITNKTTISQALDNAARGLNSEQLENERKRVNEWLNSHSCQ